MAENIIDSEAVKAAKQLVNNLDFICDSIGIKLWEVSKNSDVFGVGKSTLYNYKDGKFPPSTETKNVIIQHTKEFIDNHPILANYIPPITEKLLFNKDMKAISEKYREQPNVLRRGKFINRYICIYSSTNVIGEKNRQYGIINIKRVNEDTGFDIDGVFLIDDYDDASSAFSESKQNENWKDNIIKTNKNAKEYSGNGYLSSNSLWMDLFCIENNTRMSISFDLNEKITSTNPDENFMGAKGIALSLSSDSPSHSVTFPIVLLSAFPTVSYNEVQKYLSFNTLKLDDEYFTQMSEKVFDLIDSLKPLDYDQNLRTSLLSALLRHDVKNLLNDKIFASMFIDQEEKNRFNTEVLKLPRQKNDE